MSLNKKKLLDHLAQDVYCQLGISPIHGIGVFAIRAIPKGVNPFGGFVGHDEIDFTKEEVKHLPRSVRKVIDAFCYVDATTVSVPVIGLNTVHLSVYMNHSKTPNMKCEDAGVFKALRPIRQGEELFFDYDEAFDEVHTF